MRHSVLAHSVLHNHGTFFVFHGNRDSRIQQKMLFTKQKNFLILLALSSKCLIFTVTFDREFLALLPFQMIEQRCTGITKYVSVSHQHGLGQDRIYAPWYLCVFVWQEISPPETESSSSSQAHAWSFPDYTQPLSDASHKSNKEHNREDKAGRGENHGKPCFHLQYW